LSASFSAQIIYRIVLYRMLNSSVFRWRQKQDDDDKSL